MTQSDPLVSAPIIVTEMDPNQLMREGIDLDPDQTGTMTVRFAIADGTDLESVINAAKA